MPSPFPGMDPYLEGEWWPDVHHALADAIRRHLVPKIAPKYVARIEVYMVEDTAPGEEVGIFYPDVEVLRSRRDRVEEPPEAYTPVTVVVPALKPISVKISNVEIRTRSGLQLVTAIEILSPVNKKEPGLSAYRRKRQDLREAGVHLLEVDLLRRGMFPFAHQDIPPADYRVALTQGDARETQVWAFNVEDEMPTVPLPLQADDDAVTLNLQLVFSQLYEEARYDLSIDYRQDPPPPTFSDERRRWMQERVARA